METKLKQLYKIFFVDPNENYTSSKEDSELYKPVFSDLHLTEDSTNNPLKLILDHVYETNNLDCLKRLLNTADTKKNGVNYSLETDIDFAFHEFIEDEQTDKDESYEIYASSYGHEGQNIYHVYTKNYMHVFSSYTPFEEDINFEYSEKLD